MRRNNYESLKEHNNSETFGEWFERKLEAREQVIKTLQRENKKLEEVRTFERECKTQEDALRMLDVLGRHFWDAPQKFIVDKVFEPYGCKPAVKAKNRLMYELDGFVFEYSPFETEFRVSYLEDVDRFNNQLSDLERMLYRLNKYAKRSSIDFPSLAKNIASLDALESGEPIDIKSVNRQATRELIKLRFTSLEKINKRAEEHYKVYKEKIKKLTLNRNEKVARQLLVIKEKGMFDLFKKIEESENMKLTFHLFPDCKFMFRQLDDVEHSMKMYNSGLNRAIEESRRK